MSLKQLHLALIILSSLNSSIAAVHHIKVDASDSDETIISKAASLTPNKPQLLHHLDEFNGFIHFGPNTFTGVEWGNGMENPAIFNPPIVDTDQWCRIMKAAGMRKVVITAKHHDGYCIWQTRYNKKFSVHQSPWLNGKGDVLRKLSASCQKYGLKLGFYLSPADLYQIESQDGIYGNQSPYVDSVIPTDPSSFKTNPMQARTDIQGLPKFQVKADDYNRYFMNQLYELLTEYGPIHEVWFDGAHPKRKGNQQYIRAEWFNMIRQLAPEAAIFGGPDVRWCGNEHGGTRQSEWNVLPMDSYATSGYDRPVENIGTDAELLAGGYEVYGEKFKSNYLYYVISEVDVSIRKGWFYRNDTEQMVRDADDVFDMYERSVGGNAAFLLNIPPNRQGQFAARDVATLVEVGRRVSSTYATNLAAGAHSDAAGVLDGRMSSFWQPDGERGAFQVQLPVAQKINRILLQENIASVGQRVRAHALDAWIDGQWNEIAQGTTIGYKKILRFAPVTTDRFRVRILGSRLAPTICNFSAHYYQSPPQALEIKRDRQGLVAIQTKTTAHESVPTGAVMRYTLDGSEPKLDSAIYSKPFELPLGGVVNARSYDGLNPGPIASRRLGMDSRAVRLVNYSSEQAPHHSAANAIDGLVDTHWLTSPHPQQPHQLVLDLGANYLIEGITYLPRQDRRTAEGLVESGFVEISRNGKTWRDAGRFTFGNLLNDPSERSVFFEDVRNARYLRIRVDSGVQGTNTAGAAEIQILVTSR